MVEGEVGGGLEVVDDPADGLDVGVLGLPLIMAAVLATLHDVHATAEVWLLVHHPTEDGEKKVGGFITGYYNDLFAFFLSGLNDVRQLFKCSFCPTV